MSMQDGGVSRKGQITHTHKKADPHMRCVDPELKQQVEPIKVFTLFKKVMTITTGLPKRVATLNSVTWLLQCPLLQQRRGQQKLSARPRMVPQYSPLL